MFVDGNDGGLVGQARQKHPTETRYKHVYIYTYIHIICTCTCIYLYTYTPECDVSDVSMYISIHTAYVHDSWSILINSSVDHIKYSTRIIQVHIYRCYEDYGFIYMYMPNIPDFKLAETLFLVVESFFWGFPKGPPPFGTP